MNSRGEVSTKYFISTVVLALVLAAFFWLARGQFRQFGAKQWTLRVVVAMPLAISCIGHFTRTATFATIVPPVFPHPEFWVVLTGILELAGAIGLLLPKTTKAAATCVAWLMIAVFPANVLAANQTVAGLHMPGVPVRLAMQAIYILLVLVAGWGIPRRAHADINLETRSRSDANN